MNSAIIILLLALLLVVAVIFVYANLQQPMRLTNKETDLADVMPIQYIDDGMIVNGNGDITVGYRLMLPEVFSLSDEDANQIHSQLQGLLKLLPAGTIFHEQNFYYNLTYQKDEFSDNYLMSEKYRSFNGKEILQSYSNIYLTFRNVSMKKIKRSSTATSLLKKPKYILKQPFKDIVGRKKEIEDTLVNFENSMAGMAYFSVQKMSSDELNNAVFDYVNLSFHKPTADATKEVVQPISVDDSGNFKVGDTYMKVISLREEGSRLDYNEVPNTGPMQGINVEAPQAIKSKCSMVYPLGLGLPFNHILNVIIEVTDTDDTTAAVKNEQTTLNFLANFYPPAREKQREQEMFLEALLQKNYQTAYTALNVIVADKDLDSLRRKVSYVQQGFIKMNHATCYVENEENANLFFCSMPGNAASVYRGFMNTTIQAVCYLQKENMYLSTAEGFVFKDRFGTPCKIDLWNFPGVPNRNRLVFGPSGSGKSFLLNNLILQGIAAKRDMMIIDIGGSYKSMVALNHGKYFDSNNPSEFQFNPFLCPQDKLGNYVYFDPTDEDGANDHIKTISTVISFIWKGDEKITPTETALLEKAIKAFYDWINTKREFPNMISFSKFLEEYENSLDDYERKKIDFKEIRILLEPYTVGELRSLLNAESNIDIVNDSLLCFDMEGVSKQSHFPLVAIILLQLIIGKIKRRQGVEKTLIIDEALDFLKDPKFGDFIAYLYRTFRKKEGEICLAAQNVLFLKSAPELVRDSIVINTSTKILLDHSQHIQNLKDIQEILSLSDAERDMVASLQSAEKWREFYIKIGNSSFIFRNEVSDAEAVAFDSRQKTVVAIRELVKETGSTFAAINKYLKSQN